MVTSAPASHPFELSTNSSASTVLYLTSLSPNDLLNGIVQFIELHDQRAYNYFNHEQLRSHIIDSLLRNQICIAIGSSPEGLVIGGVATWTFRHAEKEVFLVGLVGSATFARTAIKRWKRHFPFYKLAYARRDRRREHHAVVQFNRN